MNKLNSIKGSLNVITGSGSGLGRATVQWFLKNDSGPVLGIDRFYDENYEQELDLTDEQRKKLTIRTHDTFNEEKVENSLSEFVNKHGTIDNVINVAGVALSFLLCSKTSQSIYSLEHCDNLTQFNTVGTFNMIRLASKYMIETTPKIEDNFRTKCIINASCTSTTNPLLGQTFYAGSKSSLDSMTLCIARELSPWRIRCNTINVGFFDTKLMRESGSPAREYVSKLSLCPARMGDPQEFAHLVQSIVENQMLNGCCIKIDAGTRVPANF